MEQELKRVARLLMKEDPVSERYDRLLAQYITIYRIYKETDFLELSIADATENAVSTSTEPQDAEPKKSRRKKSAPPEDLQPATEPEPSEPITEYTVEYVRGLLSEVSCAGTPVQPLVKKYTPEGKPVKLSSIPADKYPELVKELKTYAG